MEASFGTGRDARPTGTRLSPWEEGTVAPLLESTFEGNAGGKKHQDHKDEEKGHITSNCGKVCAFEEDRLQGTHRVRLRVKDGKCAKPTGKTLYWIDRAARKKQDHIKETGKNSYQARMAGAP